MARRTLALALLVLIAVPVLRAQTTRDGERGVGGSSEREHAGEASGGGVPSAAVAPAASGRAVPRAPNNAASAAAEVAPLATIRDIRRALLPDVVRVIVELDSPAAFRVERLSNPPRVFVDFASTRAAPSLVDQTLRFDGDGDIVRQVRTGRHPNSTTRVVVDGVGAASYSVYALSSPYRVVIDCVRAPAPGLLASRPLVTDWGRGLPSLSPLGAAIVADALVVVPASASAPVAVASNAVARPPSAAGTPQTKSSSGGFSIGRQLGLSVSRIVIDPGHGGHDPGAQGNGIDEAGLVLDVALRLEKLLQKTPGTEVILTRRADEFVTLQERTAIANRGGADLFLSIHANASENGQTRGVETFFLNFTSNLSASAVAARENAASGQTMGALPDFVKAIALNSKLNESRDFATQLQRVLVEQLRGANRTVKDLGVKQAPFVVLIGAAMPSVLTEIAFVTNAQEARLLRGGAYRRRIAEALNNAILKYQSSLKKATTAAHQRRSG